MGQSSSVYSTEAMANTPSSIVCFKNGFSFVTVPVQLRTDQEDNDHIKSCTVGPLPSFAVHGTVGLLPDDPQSVRIFSLSKAAKKEEELKLPIGPDFSYHSFLLANTGTYVRVQVSKGSSGNNQRIDDVQGLIKWVQPAENGAKMAILETVLGNVKHDTLIDTSKIIHMERAEKNDGSNVSSLLVRYMSVTESDPQCTLSYLSNGLTWAPSYSVLMSQDNKTVKLEGKACLLCDLPFLDGGSIAEISLVAGEPNMEYQHLADPLASGVSASDFVSQLGGGQRFHEVRAPRMMKSQMFGASFAMNAAPEMEEAEGIQGGESVGDFFHYNLKNVPLKYNHPLSIPFIDACDGIAYEDIYYLDLDRTSDHGGRFNKSEQGSVEVKHAISFTNTSGQPLTTAPVSILAKQEDNNNKFLVQGIMKYTGPAKKAIIEITRTMDVEGKFVVETEKERKTEVVNEAEGGKKQYLDSIQKKGKVSIRNSKDEEIKCKIEHQLYGHLEESTPLYKEKTERQNNHHGLNTTNLYTWEVTVPANGSLEINFKYFVKEWNTTLNRAEK